MAREIKAHTVPREKTVRLMERLLTRGNQAYHHFMDILKLKYDFLYEEIKDAQSSKFVTINFKDSVRQN